MSDPNLHNRFECPQSEWHEAHIARLTAELATVNAKLDGSYVQNCLIEPRPGDGPLFSGEGYAVRLHGYAIVDREKYERLTADLKACAEALLLVDEYHDDYPLEMPDAALGVLEAVGAVLARPGVQAILDME